MKTSPALSVLLPCRDAAATLEEALASMEAQSFEDFEVLAIDDGSSDGTGELLEAAAARDSRLRVFRREHAGITGSLRFALERARSPLVARMDADDRCHPDRFRLQMDLLRNAREVAVVGSKVRLFPREGLGDGYLRYESWVNGLLDDDAIRRDLFVESPLPHPSTLMRRDALERVGGYRDVPWPEDYDLWMRFAAAGYRFAKVDAVLLDWRDSANRASRRERAYSAESFLALKEHYLLEWLEGKREPVVIWGAGPTGKAWARRLRGRGRVVERFVELDPRKVGQRIHGAEVVAPGDLAWLRGHALMVAVASLSRDRDEVSPWRPARDEIRARLESAGFVERRDFVCVA